MPRQKQIKAAWEIGLQGSVREGRRGWGVSEHRGKVRLKLQFPKKGDWPRNDQALLPYLWQAASQNEVILLCNRIYGPVMRGEKTLKGALDTELAESDQQCHKIVSRWPEVIEAYKSHLIDNRNRIKESTYEASYGRYFTVALELLEARNAPKTGYELLKGVLHHQRYNRKPGKKFGEPLENWADQSASRVECSLAIRNMLEFAVHREHQAQSWLINPFDYDELRGAQAQRPIKAALTDQEILGLVFAIEKRSKPWSNVIKFLALYGLREWEINHLQVQRNPRGQLQLRCLQGKIGRAHV